MDKNNDGFVTLNELNDFKLAVFKEKQLTQDEVRTQQWTLKNLFPKDMLGSDNQFDFDEYWYYMNTLPITSEPGWTTPSPPTTKRNIFSKFFSEKPGMVEALRQLLNSDNDDSPLQENGRQTKCPVCSHTGII